MAQNYQPFRHTRDRRGRCGAAMEDLWDGAKAWAERNGCEYVPTYGIIRRTGPGPNDYEAIAPT
jgi:hypothetical protein